MILLRDAISTDLRSFFELDQVCFPVGIAYTPGDFRALLASRKTISIVAEEDNLPAGFAIAQRAGMPQSQAGRVITIDVAPAFRRRGVGRLLIANIEARLVGAGVRRLRLEVAVDNHGAQQFYAKLGFAPTGLIRGYYQGNLDAFVMEKTVAGSVR